MIIDLRYNGGGLVNGAVSLMEFVAPPSVQDNVCYNIIHNKSKTSNNFVVNFSSKNNFNLNRVFVITTSGTASASEMFINSLKPYMTVVQIGSRTHGKPVGMYGIEYGEYVIVPICFSTTNANNEGEYFQGLQPTIHMLDDLKHPLGDKSEDCVYTALEYDYRPKSGVEPSYDRNREFTSQGLRPIIGLY